MMAHLNTGNISTGLTKGGDGWNFVGNPYPSAVDWDAQQDGQGQTLLPDSYGVWNGATYATYISRWWNKWRDTSIFRQHRVSSCKPAAAGYSWCYK